MTIKLQITIQDLLTNFLTPIRLGFLGIVFSGAGGGFSNISITCRKDVTYDNIIIAKNRVSPSLN